MSGSHNHHQYQATMQGQHDPGQGRQANPTSKGNQGPQKPINIQYDPKLANWAWKKGKYHDSWKDVRPEKVPVSLENIRQDLARLDKKPYSIQRTLKDIPSDNARAAINTLIASENQALSLHNRNLEWKIVGIELEWQSLNRKHRQLRGIDIFLETESRPGTQANGVKSKPPMHNMDPHEIVFIDEPVGMSHEKPFRAQGVHQGQNAGQAFKKSQTQDPNMGGTQHFLPAQASAQGPVSGPPQPPPPPPIMPQQNVQQGISGGPPQVHMLPQQQKQQQQQHQSQSQHQNNLGQQHHKINQQPQHTMPTHIPSGAMHPGMQNVQPQFVPVENLNPHVLKQQKAKQKSVPAQYVSDSESSSDSLSDASYSAESMDGFNVVNRSRSRSQGKKKTAEYGILRDPSRGRTQQAYNEKSSHGRVQSEVGRPPLGKYNGKSSQNQSPRSSHSNLPPQQIHIEVNTASTSKDQAEKGPRNNARGRAQERTREQSSPRPHERHHHNRSHDFEREHRHSHDRSMSRSPKQAYSKFEKFARGHIPRPESTDRGSGSFYDDEDDSSIESSADGSVFSQSPRSGHGHRGSRQYDEVWGRVQDMSQGHYRSSNEEIHPAFDPRKQRHHSPSEMPAHPPRHQRHPGSRHSVRHSEGRRGRDGGWSDDADIVPNWPPSPRGVSRRNSPNPFDSVRYPAQHSHSYVEPPLEHTYPPFATPAPKALPQHARHDSFDVDKIFQAGLESLNEKNRNAAEHIHSTRQRRPLGRSATYDPWANDVQYPGGHSRQRQSVTRLPNGQTMYATIV
ncbi:hypothetical protein K491DRAFT_151773 [Lophiostoma macrostomum CBS 122681]|uniref:Uncharacterized protein n=1 Tax=Lophiostoma macrostomum CBS 122681 TaxID=1314788 RepID=A0A6A6TK39_9PLEO|nr:hypothetical protein K491DRAFT_151773 [Lophiostoma macrostomum CBS 122681]